MTNWHVLASLVDQAVDGQFGETAFFTAWKQADDYTVGGPDLDRVIPSAVGCYVNPAARVMPPPGASYPHTVNADFLLSIREAYLVGVQQGDRVFLSDRGFYGEIAYIEPGDTDRSVLHLLRIKADHPIFVSATFMPLAMLTQIATGQVEP
jgi:hypothetical protein